MVGKAQSTEQVEGQLLLQGRAAGEAADKTITMEVEEETGSKIGCFKANMSYLVKITF